MLPQKLLPPTHVRILPDHDFLDPEEDHRAGAHGAGREGGVDCRAGEVFHVELAGAVEGGGFALVVD